MNGEHILATFKPIGVVVEGLPRPGVSPQPPTRFLVESTIRVYDEYVEGLEGLVEYSHIIVVYWMHEVKGYNLKARPWGDERAPIVGVFATRSPNRPNPIGITVVELLEVKPPYLRVRGLDAWPGSPVLDIKPYDYYDIVKNPKVPSWFKARWEEWRAKKGYERVAPWLGPCECLENRASKATTQP